MGYRSDKPPLNRSQLTGYGDLFGWVVKRRELCEPIVEMYTGDDGIYHFVNEFSIHWAGDLRRMAQALEMHGHINPGACDPLNPEGEVK